MPAPIKRKTAEEQLAAWLDKWQQNPMQYIKMVLGVRQTWKLQDDLINVLPRAIAERKPIFVASGHALGKDYICGAIGLWFLQCFRPSIVLSTAPTERQVERIMWKETQGHWGRRQVDLGGKAYTAPRIEITPEWYWLGFATKETGATKEGGGGKFQGYHSPSVAVIVTECQSIEDHIRDQIDAVATSQNLLLVFIGNPTRAKGWFAAGLKDKEHNIVFNFSCLENPNYLEKRIVIPGLATYEWVEDKRRRWGEEDPRWQGRVCGQVPDVDVSKVFTPDVLNVMSSRHGFLAVHSDNRGVAVDAAGEGVDDCVIMSGSGGEVLDVYTKAIIAPSVGAVKAVEMCRKVNGSFIVFDCDGVGIGWYQEACKLPESYTKGIRMVKFHGNAAGQEGEEDDTGKFRPTYQNLRSEAAFLAKERGARGQAAINSADRELLEDLDADTWFENPKTGKIQLVDKQDIKDLLDRSPGRGDAWKMLQWGFEQNFQPAAYNENEQPRQEYADMNGDLVGAEHARMD